MESGKGGKGSPTLFVAFVFVKGFISKYLRVTFTANGKLRNSQIENEPIKTAQTILIY